MNKAEFLLRLRRGLHGLPENEITERLSFYSEMVDDRIEEGRTEEEAVRDIGKPEALIEQIIADTPITKLVKARLQPQKERRTLEIVLLALGSPIWVTLLLAVLAVVFFLYVSLWSVVIALWAVFAALVVGGAAGVGAGVIFALRGKQLSCIAMIGAGALCLGFSVFLFYGCKGATRGIAVATQKLTQAIKNLIRKKEEA